MMILALVCCCAAFAPIVLCAEKPSISFISKEQIKSIGQNVEFNCTVQNAENYQVIWYKKVKGHDRVLLANNGLTLVTEKRITASHDKATSTYTLRIDKLQENDTGFYQCQILISLDDQKSAEVELQIRRPPTINANSTRSVDVAAGTTVDLHCSADGFPVPRIEWKRDGDALFSNGSSSIKGSMLQLNNTSKDDRGLYYCIAENGEGPTDRLNVSVRVLFAPVVTAVRPRVGQAPGYDIDLECKIEAYPAPKVTWYRDGNELKKEEFKSGKDEFVSTLTRYSIGASDYGEYVCRAENKNGKDETKIDLFETIVPACPPACG